MAAHIPLDEMPDADLMARVQWSSERAFAELYRRYHRRLLDFFYGMGRDAHLAEDLCHETFLRIWKLRAHYTMSGMFAAYLFGVARNIWLEQRRQARKDWRLGVAVPFDERVEQTSDAHQASPAAAAEFAEIDARIFAALEQLPDEQRTAFVLRTIEGLSLDDIAAVMECPVNTVRSRRLLAIKQLRALLRGLFVL